MKKKVTDYSVKFLTVFTVLCFFCLFLVSCDFGNLFDPTFDDSLEEYLDYWASTCQVGQIDYVSSHVTMDDGENLSAQDKIELEIIVINPKEYNLLCKNGGGSCFSFRNEAGNLTYSEYTEEVVNTSKIKITARLTDASEGQKITLTGCLWPENTSNFTEESLRQQNKDLFYNTSFIQNTPPEEVKNVYVPPYTMNNKHYVSFEIPDQSKNRNKGVKFEVQYFLRENGGLNFKGSKVLSLNDSKTPGNIFTYYFDEQEDFLAYEYSVKVWGGRGLSIEQVSTDPGLGVHVMVEPTITFGTPLTGHTDAQGYEYIEVASGSATVPYTISSDEAGAVLSGSVDGVPYTGAQNGNLAVGAHTIVATVHKDMCRDVTVTRKIMVAQSMNGAMLTFTGVTYGNTDTNGYRYYEVDADADVVPYSIVATEEGVSLAGTVDGVSFSGTSSGTLSIGAHTLVATVSRENYNDVTVTEKIMVVKKLAPAVLTFNPDFNGCGTDGENYEYIEVATSSATVSYGIAMPESGTTITGSVDGAAFSGAQSGRSLTIGAHTITATIHRDYYHDITVTKNVMVVKKLDAPTIGITGTTYGNTDGVYMYYEVSSANGTVGYTITSESGTTITGIAGTSYSTAGSTTENEKTGTLGINGYEITATAHKPYHRDSETASINIQVVKKLEAPNIDFTGTTYNNIDGDGYKYYEVSSANGKVGYTIASENGTTITSSLGNVSTHIKEGELGIDGYEITATAHKLYHNDSATVTKKVKVVQALQEPSISFSSTIVNAALPQSGKPTSGGFEYDVIEYSGNLKATVTNTYTGGDSTLSVNFNGTTQEGNSQEKTIASGGDGYYTITATVTKPYHNTVTVTKRVYAVLELTSPTITFPNACSDDGTNVLYRFTQHDKLQTNVTNTYSGNNSSMQVNIDGVILNGNVSNRVLNDGSHSITATVTKTYCRTKTASRSLNANIKPVSVSVSECKLYSDTDDAGDSSEIYGSLSIGKGWASHTLASWSDTSSGLLRIDEKTWVSVPFTGWTDWFYSKTDTIYYNSSNMWEDDGSNDDDLGSVSISRDLAGLKANNLLNVSNGKTHGDTYLEHAIYISLNDGY